jgi:hypothetical protein|tara:strand:- start:157 stop:948 length:792 start_codon:yes stop_codon:yes gene_type:complete
MTSGKIKILSGWSAPGGSTTAFVNLCNLFNEKGLDCTFYGPHDWHLDKCQAKTTKEFVLGEPEERIIAHFTRLPQKPDSSKKIILACHEKHLFPVKDIIPFWDEIVYVSNAQMFWQGVYGKVIPNVVTPLSKKKGKPKTAGIIGSIDKNKNTHESIRRALADGHDTVLLFGLVTDQEYWKLKIEKFVKEGKAILRGYEDDKQKMYDLLTDVYHSSFSETFNFIKFECEGAGVEYHGVKSAESGAEVLSNDEIFKLWENCLELK